MANLWGRLNRSSTQKASHLFGLGPVRFHQLGTMIEDSGCSLALLRVMWGISGHRASSSRSLSWTSPSLGRSGGGPEPARQETL